MKNKIKVLIVSHAYIQEINQEKFYSIQDRGPINIGLLTPTRWKSKRFMRWLDLEKNNKIEYYPSKVWLNGIQGGYFYSFFNILKTLKRFRPNIIHVEQEVFSLSAFEMALFARIIKKPLTLFCWENIADKPLSLPRRIIRQFIINTATCIIVGNHGGISALQKWNFKKQIKIIPQQGINTKLFFPRKHKKEKKLFTIGFLGRLTYEKGIDILLNALRLLHKKKYDCHLIIYGGGPEEKRLKRLAKELKISNIIKWFAFVPYKKVPEILCNFDVLVLPSRSISKWKEQFGHILIEAMAMGIPVIGSMSGEIPSVIGRSDLVFPEDNSEALTEILEKMILNPKWRKKISLFGLNRVNSYFTHEKIAEKYINLWYKIIKENYHS